MKTREYNRDEQDPDKKDFDNAENEVSNSTNFIQKNGKIIIIASVVVIVVIGVMLYLRDKAEKDSQMAATLLTRVMEYYEGADYAKALDGDPEKTYMGEQVKGLKYIADQFGGTPQGKIAALYTGNCYYNLNKKEEAKKYFEAAQSSDSDIIRQGGFAGLASCNELDGKYSEAANNYTQAAELSEEDNIKSRYLFYAGLCYEKSGEKDKAEKYYRDILKISEFGEFSSHAKAGLTRIGMIIE